MSQDDCTQAKQKINILKNLNNRFGLTKKYWKKTSIAWVAYKVNSQDVSFWYKEQ